MDYNAHENFFETNRIDCNIAGASSDKEEQSTFGNSLQVNANLNDPNQNQDFQQGRSELHQDYQGMPDYITQCMYYDPQYNAFYSQGALEQMKSEAMMQDLNVNDQNSAQNTEQQNGQHLGQDERDQYTLGQAECQGYSLATPFTTVQAPMAFYNQVYSTPLPYPENAFAQIPQNCFQYFDRNCPIAQDSPFQYPSIYVSHSGLITVLLRNDISVEMTLDRTIRLVSHQRRMALAANARGNACCVYHPAGKIRQENTTVEGDLFLERKVKMTTETITFSIDDRCYSFDYDKIRSRSTDMSSNIFSDLSHDYSVNLLFASDNCSDELIEQCTNVAQSAVYDYINSGYYSVKVNGVRITQYNRGDVSVVCGPKFLRLSPSTGALNVQTHFADIAIEANWSMKVRRGSHTMSASHLGFVVANGKIEAGFDENKTLKAVKLPQRAAIDVQDEDTTENSPD